MVIMLNNIERKMRSEIAIVNMSKQVILEYVLRGKKYLIYFLFVLKQTQILRHCNVSFWPMS